jgi:hypothetical protein
MELIKSSGPTQWVYVSMSAFTTNATRLGIPRNYILRHNAYDTANPSNATIRSNVSGITETNGCNTVNLEFWPSNYGGGNDYGVPGANGGTYDFGDGGASTSPGHASMQIHNYGAGQTLFAYNAWGNAGTSNLGLATARRLSTTVSTGPSTRPTSAHTQSARSRFWSVSQHQQLAADKRDGLIRWMNAQVAVGNSCDVYAYWGDTDKSTNAALWAHSALLGTYTSGTYDLTRQVTGLAAARPTGTPSSLPTGWRRLGPSPRATS